MDAVLHDVALRARRRDQASPIFELVTSLVGRKCATAPIAATATDTAVVVVIIVVDPEPPAFTANT
jgi:hypothetical protein